MTFGDFVRQEREAKGWTQKDLAARSLVSATNIGVIEAGRISTTIQTAEMLCKALGKTFTIGKDR